MSQDCSFSLCPLDGAVLQRNIFEAARWLWHMFQCPLSGVQTSLNKVAFFVLIKEKWWMSELWTRSCLSSLTSAVLQPASKLPNVSLSELILDGRLIFVVILLTFRTWQLFCSETVSVFTGHCFYILNHPRTKASFTYKGPFRISNTYCCSKPK